MRWTAWKRRCPCTSSVARFRWHRAPGQPLVRLPALSAAKVALWNAMQAEGVTKAEMARRLGVNRPQVDRLVDLLHSSKIEQVEHALAILGQRLAVTGDPRLTVNSIVSRAQIG